jgi:acyl phosphate:glycerol-3-phosphate acyltransferase
MGTVGTAVAIAVIAYLIGSIPSAYIVGRLVAGIDIRVAGEGNVGARNAYHVVGHRWGVAVCLIDAAKGGVVAVALRDRPTWQLMLGGIAVIAGHGFPLWLGFVGGKGVATASGFGIALFLPAAVIGGAGAGAVFAVTRRFLPALIVAIVGTFATAMILGGGAVTLGVVLGLFALTGVKRALDEPRMREIEASTGWDRAAGGTS